jgi:hypothetical protein
VAAPALAKAGRGNIESPEMLQPPAQVFLLANCDEQPQRRQIDPAQQRALCGAAVARRVEIDGLQRHERRPDFLTPGRYLHRWRENSQIRAQRRASLGIDSNRRLEKRLSFQPSLRGA